MAPLSSCKGRLISFHYDDDDDDVYVSMLKHIRNCHAIGRVKIGKSSTC